MIHYYSYIFSKTTSEIYKKTQTSERQTISNGCTKHITIYLVSIFLSKIVNIVKKECKIK